jgi:hypothetical protein
MDWIAGLGSTALLILARRRLIFSPGNTGHRAAEFRARTTAGRTMIRIAIKIPRVRAVLIHDALLAQQGVEDDELLRENRQAEG